MNRYPFSSRCFTAAACFLLCGATACHAEPESAEPKQKEKTGGVWTPKNQRPDSYPEGRMLKLSPEARTTLVAARSAGTLVPWSGAGSKDLLFSCNDFKGNYFYRLYKQKGVDDRGMPLYAPGEWLTEAVGFSIAGGRPQTIFREDGTFDLLTDGAGTPYPGGTLLFYRNTGAPGEPRFAAPVTVEIRGGKPGSWSLFDVDGDGVLDILGAKVRDVGERWPDGRKPWGIGQHPNMGPQRGYSMNNKWLGGFSISTFHWRKGSVDESGKPSFGPVLPIYQGDFDFALQWVNASFAARIGAVRHGDQLYLVVNGGPGGLLAVPATLEGEALRCGDAVPILEDGKTDLEHTYINSNPVMADFNDDGQTDLLFTGFPHGSAEVISGDAIGEYREYPLYVEGGLLTGQQLVVAGAARLEWRWRAGYHSGRFFRLDSVLSRHRKRSADLRRLGIFSGAG